jgi:PAS domain S-box-containing protein
LGENYLKPLGISSMLDAPVWVSGKVVGVLCHEHTGPARDWSAEEIDFVSVLASMVSLALEESNRARSERLLRESEEKFRALFEGTSQAVVLHDENGIFDANPSWVQLLGYSRLEDVIGKHPAEISAPIQPGGERAETLERKHIANALVNGSARFEWIVLRRDGTEIPIEIFLTPIQLGGRQLIQAVCNDITQRKQAEAELLRTLAREKELGQLRSNFVSMVSHEFRTPLAIIQSSAEILDDYQGQLEKAERKDHLQSIRKNTRRMAALMEETLLIGSFDAGKMEFKPTLLELRTFVRRLVDEVLSATNRRCPIEFLLAEMPTMVQADGRLLRHIFTNLLHNAVKYSDAGRVVQFEIVCPGADIVCTIRDKGIGIPEADREWLFNAFHRGRNVGDRPGTGLGLVIVKRCVDLHGGQIKVESKLGEGTVVTVRLPI